MSRVAVLSQKQQEARHTLNKRIAASRASARYLAQHRAVLDDVRQYIPQSIFDACKEAHEEYH